MAATIALTPKNVRAFRARRSHLVGPGAPDLVTCARDLVGAQAQVESCALHALSLRTAGRPTATEVGAAMLEDRGLVRTWGQRDTLHLYATAHWPLVIAARPVWVRSSRRGGMPSEDVVEIARRLFADAGRPLVRSDMFDMIPDDYVASLEGHPGAGRDPRRFAATRLIQVLAMLGHVAFAHKEGREQAYVHRDLWYADLDWAEPDADEAAAAITRHYLSVFGPATVQDIAHYVGARVSDCRRWMKRLDGELIACAVDGKKGLLALATDADDLRAEVDEWPTRLLPAYDTMLMAHKDKRWILPEAAEEKLVWKKAAVVAATVIAEGQIVATWTHNRRTREVDVEVTPLSGWRDSLLPEVEREAAALAAHLELDLGGVAVV